MCADTEYKNTVPMHVQYTKISVEGFGSVATFNRDQRPRLKYTEGNNRPVSVNQISLVHNPYKSGIKCYTQDNANIRETQVRE